MACIALAKLWQPILMYEVKTPCPLSEEEKALKWFTNVCGPKIRAHFKTNMNQDIWMKILLGLYHLLTAVRQ